MLMPRLAAFTIALGCAACANPEPPIGPTPAIADMTAQAAVRGQQLAAQACASCHATGTGSVSPMAEATPFREIAHRYPLDRLQEAFAQGLVTSHPAMPPFVFRAGEIDDLIAYLETVDAE